MKILYNNRNVHKRGNELKDYERNNCSIITYILLTILTVSQQSIKFTGAEETRPLTTFLFQKKKVRISNLKY